MATKKVRINQRTTNGYDVLHPESEASLVGLGNCDNTSDLNKPVSTAQQAEIDKVKDIISDEYSSTKAYAIGDYCIYDNVLYKCNTSITSESWNASHWTSTTAMSEVSKTNNNLLNKFATITVDMSRTAGNLDIKSYPAGFTWQNSAVISTMISTSDHWFEDNNRIVIVGMYSNAIFPYQTVADASSIYYICKITLMRTDI